MGKKGKNKKKKQGGKHNAVKVVDIRTKEDLIVIRQDREVTNIPVPSLEGCGHPAKVTISGRMTESVDFNSVSIGVQVEFPCQPTLKAVEDTRRFLSEYVEHSLEEEYKKLKES